VEKHKRKTPLGTPRSRWEDSIKITTKGTCELDESDSGWEPVAGCCEHSNEPSGSENCENIIGARTEHSHYQERQKRQQSRAFPTSHRVLLSGQVSFAMCYATGLSVLLTVGNLRSQD
jgi:hypothetical protein